jgi:signal transduction protein with GAF and PtsI domain
MASKTPHKKELGKITLKVGEGLTGWTAQQSKPVIISKSASQDERFKKFDDLPEDKYESFLAFPIIRNATVVGVINVQHKNPHEYAESSINLMNLIIKQVGGTVDNARLYEETKQKALQFDSLNKVTKSVASESYLDEILNLIVVVTAEMLDSKICSIMLLDKKGNELTMRATHTLSEEYKKKPNIKVKTSISGQVIQSKTPKEVHNVQEEEGYNFKDLAKKEGLTSMLAVPMIVKDVAIGVINVYTQNPHHFTDEEISVLQMVANQAAVAVENTKLVDEALRAKEALETRKLVDRAKGVLMRMKNLDEDAAYRLIHKKAMDSCKTMKDIAESILLLADLE